MLSILDIPLSEILIDPAAVSENISCHAARQGGLAVTGIGVVNDRLLVFFEPAAGPVPVYRVAPMEGVSAAEIIGEVRSRWGASFSTVGIFHCGSSLWGLFRHKGDEAI